MRLKRKEISCEEFEQVKQELRRKRQIPTWFKKRFILDYDDQLPKLKSALVCDKMAEKTKVCPPRVRQAKTVGGEAWGGRGVWGRKPGGGA